MAALNLEVFEHIEARPLTTSELGDKLKISNLKALEVLLRILEKHKLVVEYEKLWSNMPVIRDNLEQLQDLRNQIKHEQFFWNNLASLLSGKQNISDSFRPLNRKEIDLKELSEFFPDFKEFRDWNQLPLKYSPELNAKRIVEEEHYVLVLSCSILDDLKINEIRDLFQGITQCMGSDGYLVLYGAFMENSSLKTLQDNLEMAVETGEVLYSSELKKILSDLDFYSTEDIQLNDGNTVFFVSKNENNLKRLNLSELDRLKTRIRQLGFNEVLEISPEQVVTAPFTQNLCDYGCRSGSNPKYMKKCSHHDHHDHQKTREIIDSYNKALLLCGEPPTGDFQKRALSAQAEAFKSDYYKAFVYWAGPCSLCEDCEETTFCRNPQMKRPSMEGAGIDVFATVKNAGKPIHTLRYQGEYIHYFALLLLE